jgi:alkylation response protein AidB-like acyl-CoA dehydrogenase
MAEHGSGGAPAAEAAAEMDQIVEVARRLSREKIAPQAQAIDSSNEFPREIYRHFHEIGLIGLLVPEELGGAGASLQTMVRVYAEVAQASAACGLILSNSVEALVPIVTYAQPELRDAVLQRVLVDSEIPCFALTEPSAGSDATGIATQAQERPDGYVISGRKTFITNGSVGGMYLVFAQTDPSERKGRRLSAFLVDRTAPGFAVGVDEKTMGTRGSPLTELILDDVHVAASRMVGERGDGLKVAMKMLNESRVGAAAQCVGICQDALEKAVAYSAERRQFGQPIASFQAVQLMLADMAIRTQAGRQLTAAAALAHDEGRADAVSLSAMCKTFASDSAVQNALEAIQIYGGYGYCQDFGVERLLRDAKSYQIFDGTNQIQRITIAKGLTSAAGG